jgi:hypothetical protein
MKKKFLFVKSSEKRKKEQLIFRNIFLNNIISDEKSIYRVKLIRVCRRAARLF